MKRVIVKAVIRPRNNVNAGVIANEVINTLRRQGFNVSNMGMMSSSEYVYNWFTTNYRYTFSVRFIVNNNYPTSTLRNVFVRAINPYAIIVTTSSQLGEPNQGNEPEGDESDIQVVEETDDSSETTSDNSLAWVVGGALVVWLLSRD